MPSRRSLRTSRPVAGTRSARRTPSKAKPRSVRSSRVKGTINIVVMTLAVGLVATISLPSYAFDPVSSAQPAFAAPNDVAYAAGASQTVAVSNDAASSDLSRDALTATSEEELQSVRAAAEAAAQAAEAAKQAETLRAQLATTYTSYSGPSASDFLANPPYPNFDLGQVYQVGLEYQGVPYVYGGATPSGFDCSGFVMFVYAQFGIPLAHSVRSQAASGTVISQSDAQPGDLVIFNDNSHDGIYAGNGNILHAPYEGASVRVQPLWSSDVHFVRLGI